MFDEQDKFSNAAT